MKYIRFCKGNLNFLCCLFYPVKVVCNSGEDSWRSNTTSVNWCFTHDFIYWWNPRQYLLVPPDTTPTSRNGLNPDFRVIKGPPLSPCMYFVSDFIVSNVSSNQCGVLPYNCLSPSPHQHTDVCQYCNDLRINPHFLWSVNNKITHKLKPDIIFQIDTKSSELFYAILIADKRHLQFLLSCCWNSFDLL